MLMTVLTAFTEVGVRSTNCTKVYYSIIKKIQRVVRPKHWTNTEQIQEIQIKLTQTFMHTLTISKFPTKDKTKKYLRN